MTIVAADKQTVVAPEQTAQKGWAPIELFAAGLAFLLPIAVARGLAADTWSLRAAILLVVAGVGLPILLSQTRGPRPLAARAAVAFLVFGTASAVLSHNHTTAIFGLYNQGTGLLFMASLASAWAIGRCVRPEARPLIERALLAGVFINVGVALLASVVDFGTIGVTVLDPSGRSSGLAANPVHLAALAVLGLALIVPRFVARPAVWSLPVAAIAAAAQLSGTRGALVVMAGVVIWAGRRHGLRVAAMLAVLLVLGVAGATAVGSSSAVSATARAGHLDDWRNRPVTWLSTRHVVVAH
ncbi:MAG: hypothetical protein M3N98_11575, partial [Actinomycetota bacterium]|nr:hypothetical protein [Actinomycetota bacterium]